MSSSITTFRGRWIEDRDPIIAAWLFLAAEELANLSPHEDWMTELQKDWSEQASIAGGGLLSAQFETFAVDDRRRDILLRVANRVLQRLLSFGEKIPASILNAMHMSGTNWIHDAETIPFTKAARGFINLLNGDESVSGDPCPVHRW